MSTIVLRSVKGSPLTNTEVDANFSNLNTDKTELGGTYSSGTANGVLFLSSSKVLTTGSALTFNGAALFVPTGGVESGGAAAAGSFTAYNTDAVNAQRIIVSMSGTNAVIQATRGSGTVPQILFQIDAAEQMRLTTTGLGIGTSSPNTRLTIGGYTSANQTPDIQITRTSSGTAIQTGPNVTFSDGTTNNTTTLQVTQGRFGVWNYGGGTWVERMSITSSGNLGIGTSSPGYKVDATVSTNGVNGYNAYGANGGAAEQIGYRAVNANNTGLFAGVNGFNYSGSFGTPNGAVITSIGNVALAFGTNSTERMRLDVSGNLGLGVTPSAWNSAYKALQVGTGIAVGGVFGRTDGINEINFGLNWTYTGGASLTYVASSSATNYIQKQGQHQWFTAPSGTAGNAISFSQRMTLDASGNLMLGQTSSALQSGGTGITLYGSSFSELKFLNSTTGQAATDGTALVTSGADFLINNREAGAITFGTSNTERARIDSSGNLIQTVNTTAATLSTNGTLTFSIVDNSTLRISVRGSDGTTRTATVALT